MNISELWCGSKKILGSKLQSSLRVQVKMLEILKHQIKQQAVQEVLFAIAILAAIASVKANLLASEVSDGACLPKAMLLANLHRNVNTVPILTNTVQYIPMGSRSMYRRYAEGFLGRPATSQEEIDSMKPVVFAGPLYSFLNNTGFPNLPNPPKMGQTCYASGFPSFPDTGLPQGRLNVNKIQALCVGLPARRPDGTVALKASPDFAYTFDGLVWANENSSVQCIYRCLPSGMKDFKVYASRPVLTEPEIASIKAKVLSMGFTEENIAFMRYDS